MSLTLTPDSATVNEPDVVTTSVAAYSEHVHAYADYNAAMVADKVTRFAAALEPGANILDAGCGPGRDLARFAALGHRPRGVDLNPDFVAVAATHGPAVVGDLRDLPYEDSLFDGVWACASLVHLPFDDAVTALSELHRVSIPGAPLCVSVKTGGNTGWADTAHGRRWFHHWDPVEFAGEVAAAGFTIDAVEPGPVFVDVWATAR